MWVERRDSGHSASRSLCLYLHEKTKSKVPSLFFCLLPNKSLIYETAREKERRRNGEALFTCSGQNHVVSSSPSESSCKSSKRCFPARSARQSGEAGLSGFLLPFPSISRAQLSLPLFSTETRPPKLPQGFLAHS
ncbi:hypothetical protein TNCT_41581 [Trichonephila clavata]|uniref:Uncharacterized protein n=1 Tax=Trichonephila clavata TaxID=2740835 RepID=A0A8X6FW96_TRICU|nr:hypothetical protein TNCT_41581 [Trichonephila clavata]